MPSRVSFDFVGPTQPAGTGALPRVLDITDRAQSRVVIGVGGTFVGTLQFEGTADGTAWTAVQVTNLNTGTAVTTTTTAGLFRLDSSGLLKVRLNMTAFTSSASLTALGTMVEG